MNENLAAKRTHSSVDLQEELSDVAQIWHELVSFKLECLAVWQPNLGVYTVSRAL
jgi:hypothetical protein